jgi:hypothetical protein
MRQLASPMVLHQAVQTPELSGLLPAQHESLQARPARLGQSQVQAQSAGR